MADITFDGNTQAWWVPTIAAPGTGPTVAEIAAGDVIGDVLTVDGLTTTPEQQWIPNTKLTSDYDTSAPGRTAMTLMLRAFKQSGTDDVYDLFVKGLEGFLVIRDGVDAQTAVAAGQAVDVYDCTAGRKSKIREQGQMLRYDVPLAIQAEPYEDVEVQA